MIAVFNPHPPFRATLAAALLCAALGAMPAPARAVTVFAAASLKTALDEIADVCTAQTGDEIQISYAGSSALARQIGYGAPAQIFISANAGWMDRLEADQRLEPGTRHDLLTNSLVLIAAPDTDIRVAPRHGADLAAALGDGRLAMALIGAVPAGIYGQAALQSLGLWDQVADRIAQADNVRAALRLVAVGEAPMGIVYATDAIADPRVQLLGAFPADSHPPIVYPVAILRGQDTAPVRAVLACLRSEAAGAIFLRNGFGLAEGGS